MEERRAVVDKYGQKLINSGYGLEQTRRILVGGLKGYEKKLWTSKTAGGRALHQSAGESSKARNRKKLTGKSDWFRQKKKNHEVKIVEKAGDKLQHLLSNTNPWSGSACSRGDCVTCGQGGDRLPNCTQRNILYESSCLVCNPEGSWADKNKEGTDSLADSREQPSIYVGESSRSIYERSKEHWRDTTGRLEESHMHKHWISSHQAEGEPTFAFKLVRKYRDSLSRQVGEAVRIQLRGNTLNSKAVFNRSRLTRLVIDRDWELKLQEDRQKEESKRDRLMVELRQEGEDELSRGSVTGSKRSRGEKDTVRPIKRRRTSKFPLADTNWGEGTMVEGAGEETQRFLYDIVEMGEPRSVGRQCRQSLLTPLRGVSWLAREWLLDLAGEAVQSSEERK
jgi:hypothetical protein